MRKNKQLQRFQRFILNWNRCKLSKKAGGENSRRPFDLSVILFSMMLVRVNRTVADGKEEVLSRQL